MPLVVRLSLVPQCPQNTLPLNKAWLLVAMVAVCNELQELFVLLRLFLMFCALANVAWAIMISCSNTSERLSALRKIGDIAQDIVNAGGMPILARAIFNPFFDEEISDSLRAAIFIDIFMID